MNVLALEPYFGGSHRAFLAGWSLRSRHDWTVLGLPARNWKWRMRHAAVSLAQQVSKRSARGETWDVVLCSDMLNLAEFRGLIGHSLSARLRNGGQHEVSPLAKGRQGGARRLACIAYFHENQFTYPVRRLDERDYHFGFTNFTTALAADSVWFNSAFHRSEFLDALRELLGRMPDYRPMAEVDLIEAKSHVFPPGIVRLAPPTKRCPGPLRILWAARWEHDKNPETLFAALRILVARRVDFRVSVIGEQFRDSPPIFSEARETLRHHIDRWGYQSSRDDYVAALGEADVIVSTALHEFFGMAVVEAIAAGAYPLLPRRLSYPEILDVASDPSRDSLFFYDGSTEALADRLTTLAELLARGNLWQGDAACARRVVSRFEWEQLVPSMDRALDELVLR